jgi:hypothetical protein
LVCRVAGRRRGLWACFVGGDGGSVSRLVRVMLKDEGGKPRLGARLMFEGLLIAVEVEASRGPEFGTLAEAVSGSRDQERTMWKTWDEV